MGKVSEALVKYDAEVIPEASVDISNIMQSSAGFTQLTHHQRAIVKQICEDFISGTIRTDTDIAELVGCHRNTVLKARHDRVFAHVITEIMPELIKSKLPNYITMIEKHGERDYNALKFLMQYIGVYIPRSQQAILTGRMENLGNLDRIRSPQSAIKAVVAQFGALGYTRDRLQLEIDAAWSKAKDEGLF